jgi:hypothetical protein
MALRGVTPKVDSIKASYVTRRIKSQAVILSKFKLNYAFKNSVVFKSFTEK